MNIEQAQSQARAKLAAANQKIENVKAELKKCQADSETYTNELRAYLDSQASRKAELEAKQTELDNARAGLEYTESIRKQTMQQIAAINNEAQESANSWRSFIPIYSENVQKKHSEMIDKKSKEAMYQTMQIKQQKEALQAVEDKYPKSEQTELAKLNELQWHLYSNDICAELEAALAKAEAEKAELGFDEFDIDELPNVLTEGQASKYNLGAYITKTTGSQKLMDMRNLPRGINFRSNSSMKIAEGVEGSDEIYPSKSYYMNQNYLFTNSLAAPAPLGKINRDLLPEVQTLIINEFQPYDVLTVGDMLQGAGDMIIGMVQKTLNFIGGGLMNTVKNTAMNIYIDEVSKDPSILYKNTTRDRSYFSSDPVQQVENMFNGGKWLNTYEIPYFGKEYLNSNYSSKWQVGGAEQAQGSLGKLQTENFGIDFPATPKFKVTPGESCRATIQTEFYLVNPNEKWLYRNFQFIQAIFAGTSWLNLKYSFVRPPNVYHVICPGRFQMMWAAMDIAVTFEGKLRKNKAMSNRLIKLGIKSIDEDMLWPDAWKISISLKDFTPNNFNMYANYYMNGFNQDEIASLSSKQELSSIVQSFGNYMSEVVSNLGKKGMQTASALLDQAETTFDSISKSIDNSFDLSGAQANREKLNKKYENKDN